VGLVADDVWVVACFEEVGFCVGFLLGGDSRAFGGFVLIMAGGVAPFVKVDRLDREEFLVVDSPCFVALGEPAFAEHLEELVLDVAVIVGFADKLINAVWVVGLVSGLGLRVSVGGHGSEE
jgi:hypothetical protein